MRGFDKDNRAGVASARAIDSLSRVVFSVRVGTGSDYPPLNSFRCQWKSRCSQCTHVFHRTDSKDPDIHIPNRS